MARKLVPAQPRSKKDIDTFALKIIKKFQPNVFNNDKFDIERFFDCELEKLTGISIDYQDLDPGIYGYTCAEEMVCVISKELAENEMQEFFFRSTLAHEVGHAILHVIDYRRRKSFWKSIHNKNHQFSGLKMYREQDIVTYKNPEWQAWRFAGALLMPESAFRHAIDQGLDEKQMSHRFGVNPAFIRSRMKALGIG